MVKENKASFENLLGNIPLVGMESSKWKLINKDVINEPTMELLWYQIVKIVHELKETSWYMNSVLGIRHLIRFTRGIAHLLVGLVG